MSQKTSPSLHSLWSTSSHGACLFLLKPSEMYKHAALWGAFPGSAWQSSVSEEDHPWQVCSKFTHRIRQVWQGAPPKYPCAAALIQSFFNEVSSYRIPRLHVLHKRSAQAATPCSPAAICQQHSLRHEAGCPHLKDKGAAAEPDTNYKRAADHQALPHVAPERKKILRLFGICRQQVPVEALSLSTSRHLIVSHQSGCSTGMHLYT